MAELESDLHILLHRGVEGARPFLGERRLGRARRAAAILLRHEGELRTLGLLSFGEKATDLHIAPALEEALLAELAELSS